MNTRTLFHLIACLALAAALLFPSATMAEVLAANDEENLIAASILEIPNPLPPYDGSTGVSNKPVKIYIMAGDGAMAGHGKVSGTAPGTLETIVNQQDMFPYLTDGGNWVTRNDVAVRSFSPNVITDTHPLSPTWNGDLFGLELGFGHVMGWYHDEPVLLIRCASANRALGWDYLPPGSERIDWSNGLSYAGYGEAPESWLTSDGPSPFRWYGGKQYDDFFLHVDDMGFGAWESGINYTYLNNLGSQVRQNGVPYICISSHTSGSSTEPGVGSDWETVWMVYSRSNVVDVLDNFTAVYPQWADQGFEIAGYVWWQGFRDRLTAAHSANHEANLARLINRMRNYYAQRYPFQARADAPFALATLAFEGWSQTGTVLQIANAQLAVDGATGNHPEFTGNVKTVEARDFWRTSAQSPRFANELYHGNAETHMLTGDALGRAMVEMTASYDPRPPVATTGPADAIGNSTATLTGSVDSNGLPTIASIEYGTTTGYGSVAPVVFSPNDGSGEQPVSVEIAGLLPGVTYHYRLTATNADGISIGENLTFTTTSTVTSFTPGNVVIYRVGDGQAALGNTGSRVFLDEYAPDGTLVQSIPMPTAIAGDHRRLVASGTATAEGLLARSADGRFLVLAGYDAPIPYGSSLPSTSSTVVNRTVARVAHDATVDTTTALADFSTNGGPRGVASADGGAFWLTGGTGGIRYAPHGGGSSIQLAQSPTNMRSTAIFDGQLYVSTAQIDVPARVATVGTGLPTTAEQPVSNLPGVPETGSPFAFFLVDLEASIPGEDTLYIADDGVGLRKFSLVDGEWLANGMIGTGSDNYRGLTGSLTDQGVVIYATRKASSFSTGGGELVAITDTSGHNQPIIGEPVVLATANHRIAFRGVALAPYLLSDLSVAISAPDSALTGEAFDCTITVANIGNTDMPATILDVFDQVGELEWLGYQFVGDEAVMFPAPESGINDGLFEILALAPGQTDVLILKLRVPPGASGVETITAGLDPSTNLLDEVASNDTASVQMELNPEGSAPLIVTHPTSQTIASGATATLSVAAIGNGPLTYQWHQGESGDSSQPVGDGEASFVTPLLTENTSFWVRVSNDDGSADSDTAIITVADILFFRGLNVSTYRNVWGTANLNPISNLMALPPSGSAIQIDDINYTGDAFLGPHLPGITDLNHFSVLWEGWFDVSKEGPGEYTFGTQSDDGSVIFMDLNGDGDFNDPGELIVNNNFQQAPTARTGTVYLSQASVRIVIGYFENVGGEVMEARFRKGSALAFNNLDPINGTSGHFFTLDPAVPFPPQFIAEPQGSTIPKGTSVTLNATAFGHPIPTYQWYLGTSGNESNPVSGATSASLTTPILLESRDYWVRASNSEGSIESATASITVVAEIPEILNPPVNRTIPSGTFAVLSVEASGVPAPSYQWYQGEAGDVSHPVYDGGPTLRTPPLDVTSPFWVRVSNSEGSADSGTAVVTVTEMSLAPGLALKTYDDTWGSEFLNPISNLMAVPPSGQAVQINPIDYSGYGDGPPPFLGPDFPGLTSSDTFSILWTGWFDASVDGGGEYTFGTSSDDGSVIFIDLNNDGDFNDPGELVLDNNFTQSATVRIGTVDLPEGRVRIAIGYFEQEQGEKLDARFKKGAGIPFEQLDPINGTSGHFFHEPAALTMPPIIDAQPLDQEITLGQSAMLSVETSGTGPLDYQWYQGASGVVSNPVGTNSATYNSGALANSASFWVRVANYAGSVDSDAALVTVIVPPAPAIVVEEPEGDPLVSGETRDFGNAVVGTDGLARTFVIRNAGNATLENFQLEIVRVNLPGFLAPGFVFDASGLPTTLAPGEAGDVTVTFQPSSVDLILADLRISSNDASASPFVVRLQGTGWSVPTISSQPTASQSIIYGGAVTLSVGVSAVPAAGYQWYRGLSGDTSQPVDGAEAASFTTPSLTTGTSYWVRVTNAVDSVDSATAFIEVDPISNNAALANLIPGSGTFQPVFQTAITTYQLTLASTATSLALTPTTQHPAASVTVNDVPVASGGTSQLIPLAFGDNPIEVRVTAQDGEAQRVYLINAIRRQPMFVTTGAASGITQAGATLNGSVIPNGTANVRFQYGTSTAYGNLTPILAVDSDSPVDVQAALGNLQPGTRYHFRLRADNGAEVVHGLDQIFDTLPGAPLVVTGNPVAVTTAEATLVGAVNGRGLETTVRFEYGLTNLLGTTTDDQVLAAGAGYQDVLIPISGLTPNAQYFVRLVATSDSGTSFGAILTFQATASGGGTGSPTAAPDVTTGEAVSITTNSAELRGNVDAKGGVTIAFVEFGTTAALGLSGSPVSIGDVDNVAAVSLPLSGLNPGTEYHYRIVGQNSLGTTEGAIETFRTHYLPPVVSTGTATVLTTTSVRVGGTVRASGDVATVRFRYGTNPGNLDLLVDGQPASVTGNSNVPVVATLPNLNQGTRYYYRAEAVNSGGLGSGTIQSFDVAVLSGLDRRFPDFIDAASHQGSLRVDLSPLGVGGWRFPGETTWRSPGSTATGLADGDRLVEFRPAAGHLSPATETLTIESALGLQVLVRAYSPSAAPGSGTLRVLLKPESIISSSLPPADRAQWRLAGGTTWRNSGDEVSGLVPGNHIIELKPLAGFETPSPALAVVADGQTTLATVTYYLAADPVGVAAAVVPFATVSGDSSQPFGFVGQMLSDVGAATGFVVKPRVVATAGHVVFDDGTLSASTGLKWLFQREVGVHEPVPITPRGFYLLSGYAAQRAIDNSPGVSSPDSQNLDAAAVYFADDAVGRNGYSGYLASDLPVNEFLVSDLDKTLVGYPVEAVPETDIGKLHATPAANIDFNQAYLRTYATDEIRGSGGMSGGPLFVKNGGGVWYPAAIFLGGTRQTIVRAIDSDVANLFGFAEASADAVGGSTGGSGGLGTTSPITTPDLGALRVLIEPAAARSAGARWRISSGAAYELSGSQLSNLTPASYTVQLSTVPGFLPPTPQPVAVVGGELATMTFTYEEIILPPTITSPGAVTLVRGQTLDYQITTQPAADAFTLFGALPTGVEFNASTGRITGIPQNAGVFVLQAGATNTGGSGAKTITLTSQPILVNQSLAGLRGEAFSDQLTSGETGGVIWSASNLPDGLAIEAATGVVSGVPVFAGNFTSTISITVNDATASATLSLAIQGDAPVFTLEPPATREIEFATGTTLIVAASGEPAPAYQWYRGISGNTANPVLGATSTTFTTPALTVPTSYWVRATNMSGAADSSAAAITLTPSTNPDLAMLETNRGSLTPAFSSAVLLYRITVPHATTSITVRPTSRVSQTAITVAGEAVASGVFSPSSSLAVGTTRIDVLTTAGDGINTRAYAIDVTRLPAPLVITDPATLAAFESSQLNGRVTPNGPGQVFFEYGLTEAYGQETPRQSVAGDTQVQISRAIGGLTPEAGYHFRLVLENGLGIFAGENQQFFTAPRPPTVATGSVFNSTSAQALLPGAVNPNGRPVTLWFEYGLSPALGASTPDFHPDPNGGTNALDVSYLITGLLANNVYHYRLVAESDAGISYGAIETFTATNSAGTSDGIADSPPTVATGVVDDATTTAATLRGTAIPNDGFTEVWFEYGTSPILGVETAKQLIGNGNQIRNATALIGGLVPNEIYHFRIVGRNTEGTSFGEIKTFATIFNPPIATIGTVEVLSPSSVRITGAVDPRGASAAADFLYGTDGTSFPFGATAAESPVAGGAGDVSVVLVDLEPSVTYHAVIEAGSAGGTSRSEVLTFQPGALLGLVQEFPQAVPPSERSGEVSVDLLPADVGAWRFSGETRWRQPGEVVTNLTTADRVVEFMPVVGFNRPPDEPVSVVSGGARVEVEALYYPAAAPGLASLTVNIEPSIISDPTVPESGRARWRFAGVAGDPWKDSGVTVSELPTGTHLIECKPVAGRQTPTPRNITISADETRSITFTYFAATAPMLTPPGPVSYEAAISSPALPHAFVGQVRGDVGTYSGFAVKRRVVATAAQAVFDESTLSIAGNLDWLWLPDSQQHVSKPILPRGVYIFDGYASQRTTEDNAGALSDESLNLNIAALYFSEDAARGGESGFLASDAVENPHLVSAKAKILAGYPATGVSTSNLGRLHATQPSPASFAWLTGLSFDSSAIRGFGGMAGGPLSVQPEDGAFYPAGIYVGGTNRGVVRAIDSQVIDLFSRAEVSANGGDNNVGGGITHSSFTTVSSTSSTGAVRVTILPAAAANVPAGWRLSTTAAFRTSGSQLGNLTPGSYNLYMTTVSGYPTPPVGVITVRSGQRTDITFNYSAINTAPTMSAIANRAINEDTTAGPIAFTVGDAETAAGSLSVTRSSSNTALVPNANIVLGGSGANRTVTVTPAPNQFGMAVITLTVSDGQLAASSQFTLTVHPVNDAPTITPIAGQTLAVGTTSPPIAFTIGDLETAASLLSLEVVSSNPLLLPASAVHFGGSGVNRTLTLAPVAGQLGSTTVTVTVSDGELSTSREFIVTVTGTALETWRFANFGSTHAAGDAADDADPDGDGASNLEEYHAGTDPKNPLDVFRVIRIAATGNSFSVVFPGKPGRGYTLQRAPTLSGPWQNVATSGILVDQRELTLNDPARLPARGFYRVATSANP